MSDYALSADLPLIHLDQVPLHAITEAECNQHVLQSLDAGRGGWVLALNLDVMRLYSSDKSFRELVRTASVHVADGMPLVWVSRLIGRPLPERVSGSCLIESLTEEAAAAGRSIYLLGGNAGTAEATAAVFKKRYPGLHVAGTWCPPFGFEKDAEEMGRMLADLRDSKPDIVFVALGCPKQEKLIRQLRAELPKSWWVGVGISFSFIGGELRRAPRWVQDYGLEWVHRLFQEPRRLGQRYFIDDMPFAAGFMLRAWRGRNRR